MVDSVMVSDQMAEMSAQAMGFSTSIMNYAGRDHDDHENLIRLESSPSDTEKLESGVIPLQCATMGLSTAIDMQCQQWVHTLGRESAEKIRR